MAHSGVGDTTPSAPEIRPYLVKGGGILPWRTVGVIGVLVAPFFICSTWLFIPMRIGTTFTRVGDVLIGVLSLLVFLLGALYLLRQHLTRIELTNQLTVTNVWRGLSPSLVLEPNAISGYERGAVTNRDRRRLKVVVGLLMGILVLGWLGGTCLFLLLLYSVRYGTPNTARALELSLLWMLSVVQVWIVSLPGVLVVPFARRIWQSDGTISIRSRRRSGLLHSIRRPARLRVFARQQDLDLLEAWLKEQGVPQQ